MNKLRLYLCGSVSGRSPKDVREGRQTAAATIRAHGMVPVDPVAGEYGALRGHRKWRDDKTGLSFANITLKDRYAIERSDMLMWLTADVASYGSCIEVGLAWALGKPIISVDASGAGRNNPFVAHISTFIGETLEEAIAFIDHYMVVDEAVEGG